MKFFSICISIVILFGALSLAAGQDIEKQSLRKNPPEKPAVHQTSPVPAPAPQPQQKNKRSKDKNWPRPFVPTERITADSAVSFPTDI